MYKKGTMVVLLVVLSAVYVFQCAEGPPTGNELGNYENQAPDTFISQKTLFKVAIGTDEDTGEPTNVNTFDFSVTFQGTDIDGIVDSFTYRIDGGTKVGTIKRDFSGTLELLTTSDVHTFEVYGTDDRGLDDPTPAKAIFSLEEIAINKAPETTIESGPANGSITGTGVKLGISGGDDDGIVILFRYRVDGGSEVEIAADSEGKAFISFGIATNNTLSIGAHSVSVAAVDNFGAVDESPAAVSFSVEAGFSPILTFTSGPADGGGWFAGAGADVGYSVVLSHYGGAIDGFASSLDGGAFSTFSTSTSRLITGSEMTSGNHTLIIRARDTGGAITEGSITFEAATATFVMDLVLIDDCNFTEYEGLDKDFADAGFPADVFWDIDESEGNDEEDGVQYDIIVGTRPAGSTGRSIWSPGVLGQFKTIVIWTDNSPTSGSQEALLGAYVQAGGNILLATYNWSTFNSSFREAAFGITSIFNARSDIFDGIDAAWAATRATSWSPEDPILDLAGLSWTANSGGSSWQLKAGGGANVFAVIAGSPLANDGDGAQDIRYPYGTFRDGAGGEGNTLGMGQSFRRVDNIQATFHAVSTFDMVPMIKGMMTLLTKDK